MTIDSQISCNIPRLRHRTVRHAIRYVQKHNMVKLVLENVSALRVRQLREEVRIINHLKLCALRVETNTSSGNTKMNLLINPSRNCSEERLVH